MTLAGRYRKRRLAPAVAEAARTLDAHRDEARRRESQLLRLNVVWSHASTHVERYRDLVRSGSAPRRFASLEEFADAVPPVSRAELRDGLATFRADDVPADTVRSTGGSTGEPLRLPAWRGEFPRPTAEMWAARAWYGISPDSRMLLLWGHSHLFGRGVRGSVRRLLRWTSDHLLGYERVSAYDLDLAGLHAAGARLLSHRPKAVIGYSGALDALARANEHRAADFAALGIQAIVATAEALPRSDSTEVISGVLGAPVVLEYGAAETGVIAQSHPDDEGGLRVLSPTNLVEVAAPEAGDDDGEILVTSLFRRAVPLLRYRLGDLGSPAATNLHRVPHDVGVLRDVGGRKSGLVVVGGGATVHSELFAHVLREEPAVLRYQIVLEDGVTRLDLVVSAPDIELTRRVADRLRAANPGLVDIRVGVVDEVSRSIAGKTPIVVDRRTG